MRRWLLLLIVALLPLRGWVGEAMATQMAVQPHATASATAHAAAGDCASHIGEAAAAAERQQHDNQQAFDAGCAACQACFTMALAFSDRPLPAPAFGAAPPVQTVASFASAEPARADKPPIS